MGVINEPMFSFPAVRGIQGNKEYYVVMCPLKSVPKLFSFNSGDIKPELRAQRVLNKARIPEIKRYILENKDYIFSSLTASADGEIKFEEFSKEAYRVGTLHIPLDSKLLINDGQHRRAAIEEALKENPNLGFESISIVIYPDRGLKSSQQMFCDLNKNAVKPTNSLNILFNRRDEFSQFIVDMLSFIPIFNGKTDMEKTSISYRSNKVFTLNIVTAATKDLINKKNKIIILSKDEKKMIVDYWQEVCKNMPDWQDIIDGKKSSFEVREESICTQGIILQPLGMLGYDLLFKNKKNNWKEVLKGLQKIDWKRSNPKWNNKAIINGKISKSLVNIKLTTEYIKEMLEVK